MTELDDMTTPGTGVPGGMSGAVSGTVPGARTVPPAEIDTGSGTGSGTGSDGGSGRASETGSGRRSGGDPGPGQDAGPDADGVDRVERDWQRERPDIDVSSVGVVTRIWRIARHLEQQRSKQLEAHGIDRGTLDMLAMLRRAGPPYRRTAGALTRSALITSSGVSQRLEKLERAGLISRHVDPADRRRVDVELTTEGVEVVDSVLADLMSHDSGVLAEALDDQEQASLRALLRRLLLSLEGSEPA